MLPGNGSRTSNPLTFRVDVGSKIWPSKIGLPSGSVPRVRPVRALEKSPARYAAVGTVILRSFVTKNSRYCSKLKKKNDRSRPLYSLGGDSGPPKLNP